MKQIKVLGHGCANCRATLELIDEVAKASGVALQLDKIEDMEEIASYGVMSTPGVVVDGSVVHAGGVPSREQVEAWIQDRRLPVTG